MNITSTGASMSPAGGNLSGQFLATSLSISSLCLVVWELIITLDQEFEYIWNGRPQFTPVHFVFALNRWWSPLAFSLRLYFRFFLNSISAHVCLAVQIYLIVSQAVHLTIIELAMALSVWALYQKSRKVGLVLAVLVLATALHLVVVSLFSLLNAWKFFRKWSGPNTMAASDCRRVSTLFPPVFNTVFYPLLVLEIVLFCMTIFQAFRYKTLMGRAQPFLMRIVKCGAAFFVCEIGTILFAIFGTSTETTIAAARYSSYILPILSINCSRLILTLRGGGTVFHNGGLAATDLETTQAGSTGTTGTRYGTLILTDFDLLEEIREPEGDFNIYALGDVKVSAIGERPGSRHLSAPTLVFNNRSLDTVIEEAEE
ncbi:hypothetical protein M422DRAFT_68106 [Sphaerobolus stellatus SS14]|uniref:DUF6533 domain-containing protein n=1 Tax=Sphaerobolus stellatus (strain SS14) TaxID=990650 RepID=A0A0C9V4Y3_SPHS4|nr:hypothetical protein M422DRAFT_68106 [Sphaerobolus stellatus SS14]